MNGGDLICAVRGPLTLMTVGALFALNNFTPYKFYQTWPVLLIVFGLLSLARRGVEHVPSRQQSAPLPGPSWIQPPPAGSAANYRQSGYPDSGTRTPGAGDAK
jgi:hypothetical protein